MGDEVEHEQCVLSSLPELVRADLQVEVRRPLILCHSFFCMLSDYTQRFSRELCISGLICCAAERNEVIFSYGEDCMHMIFIESGDLVYTPKSTLHADDDSPHSPQGPALEVHNSL